MVKRACWEEGLAEMRVKVKDLNVITNKRRETTRGGTSGDGTSRGPDTEDDSHRRARTALGDIGGKTKLPPGGRGVESFKTNVATNGTM